MISQNKRWRWSAPPPPITLIELINSKIFMNPALCHTGRRIHKISSTLSKVIGDGGGGGALHLRLLFCKLCAMINFSLHHNVLCFSFFVVLYSMYSLYAIIKVVLLKGNLQSAITDLNVPDGS